MFNLPPPPGFLGLREELPLECYMRHMPHWRQDGATYVATFRLADSLPKVKRDELTQMRDEWMKRHPEPRSRTDLEQLATQVFREVEKTLDAGHGDCCLKQEGYANLIVEPMHHFDGQRYELDCYVVMPNHVHVVLRPTQSENHSVESILKSWKSHSGLRINRSRGKSREVWQQESYDRIVRDGEHLWRTIQYIGRNPERAGLAKGSCPLWIRPAWVKLGWRFEDGILGHQG
jgi:putative transposase